MPNADALPPTVLSNFRPYYFLYPGVIIPDNAASWLPELRNLALQPTFVLLRTS